MSSFEALNPDDPARYLVKSQNGVVLNRRA